MDWDSRRDDVLDELMRHDGFKQDESCHRCRDGLDPAFRCLDCFGSPYVCRGCIRTSHAVAPLHRIEVMC